MRAHRHDVLHVEVGLPAALRVGHARRVIGMAADVLGNRVGRERVERQEAAQAKALQSNGSMRTQASEAYGGGPAAGGGTMGHLARSAGE